MSQRQRQLRGRANRGQSASVYINRIQKATSQYNIDRESSPPIVVCPVIAEPLVQLPTTPDQNSYILSKAVACPLLYVTPPTMESACQNVYGVTGDPLLPGSDGPQGPAVRNVYRQFPRIGTTDEIAKPLLTTASSDRTTRIRSGIESQSATRYVLTDIPIVPYPSFIPTRTGPQPGVPVAPNNACGTGVRRFNLTNPVIR